MKEKYFNNNVVGDFISNKQLDYERRQKNLKEICAKYKTKYDIFKSLERKKVEPNE